MLTSASYSQEGAAILDKKAYCAGAVRLKPSPLPGSCRKMTRPGILGNAVSTAVSTFFLQDNYIYALKPHDEKGD